MLPEPPLTLPELPLTEADVESAIAPYIELRLPAAGRHWLQIVAEARSKQEARLRHQRTRNPRRQTDVEAAYTRRWSRPLRDLWAPKVVPFEWRGEGLLMHSVARRRLNHLLLARALRATGGHRVLEVGMGTGFNLFLLAVQRPELQLVGVELTEAGVSAAAALRAEPTLSETVVSFGTETVVDQCGHTRVAFVRGTAAALPFRDRSFDVVCTVLALEQMEAIRRRALAEIRRVSDRWVVMIEPFRDLNADGVRASYVQAVNYFGETIDGLANHGLAVRAVYRDLPNKLTLHVGLVVAERDEREPASVVAS